MNLKDQKRDFIDIYGQRISWSSQAERKMFENDVKDLIIATREEQFIVDLRNFKHKLNEAMNDLEIDKLLFTYIPFQ